MTTVLSFAHGKAACGSKRWSCDTFKVLEHLFLNTSRLCTPFLQQSQSTRRNRRQSEHSPTRLIHGLVCDHARGIPNQMSDAVEAMEVELEGDEEFCRKLERYGPRGEAGGQDGALDVPSEVGCGEVQSAVDVKAAAQDGAGDAVVDGQVPGDLWAVDAEMRRDGAVQTLLDEDLVAGLLIGNGLRRNGSGGEKSQICIVDAESMIGSGHTCAGR